MSVRYYKKYSIIFGNSLFVLNNNIYSKCCKSNRNKNKNIEVITASETVEIKDKDNFIKKKIDKSDENIDKKEFDNDEKQINNIYINDNTEKDNNDLFYKKKIDKNINDENINDEYTYENDKKNAIDNIYKDKNLEIDKNVSLYDINKFYIVFNDNNLKDDEIKILVDHYKYKNELLRVEQYENLLTLINEEFDNEKLLKLIKLKLNYTNNNNNEKFDEKITYENGKIIYKINGIEYTFTGNEKKENIINIKHIDSFNKILLDIKALDNLVSNYVFENNENLNSFNNYILKIREESKMKKALAKVLVNAVLNYNLEYFQGMNYFAEFFLLLTAKKDNYSVTYNEKEALKLFNLFLNMKFDKIIIKSYLDKKEFQIKDFFNKDLISKLLPNIKNLLDIINNNLGINLNVKSLSELKNNEKNTKIFSSLICILQNFNINKIKTYNDLKKMFLLLFLTHNYNVIFDIFAISTLKFMTSKNVNDEFLIDLSLD